MEPVKPSYDGACVCNIAPAVLGDRDVDWLPDPVTDARTVVLLVVDGLGWDAVTSEAMPTVASMQGEAITTVVPSTTVVALTSIATGLPPSEHGIVGYRFSTGTGVLNLLRWKLSSGGEPPPPDRLQPHRPFGGRPVPVVTGAHFEGTGFTDLHLRGVRFTGSHASSDIIEHVGVFAEAGEPFVYAYYGGLDIITHMQGMDTGFYPAELGFVDGLVSDLLDRLPSDVCLLVTADHGHVPTEALMKLSPLKGMVETYAGEGRFRYLHAKPGAADDLASAARDHVGDAAWVFTRRELFDGGWFGPRAPDTETASRVGDVVIASSGGTIFEDPTNPGELKLRTGHGSLTPREMLVPLVAARGRR